jgi:hypothetical protein
MTAAITDSSGSVVRPIDDRKCLDSILYTCWGGEAQDDPRFVLLRCIDPYDRTIFNATQIERFLEEWDALKPLLNAVEQEGWAAINDAVRAIYEASDRYLTFFGD